MGVNISSLYDIRQIIADIEVALQIDGQDYAEKDFDIIMERIKTRLIRQYNVDLTRNKITDDDIYVSKSKNSAILFMENVANLHGRLCGYLHIVRYTREVEIKPINVNYLGYDEDKLMSVLKLMQYEKHIPVLEQNIESLKNSIGTINACLEKKVFLILLVAHELGFDELMSCASEILYLGGKV